ncbi:hypothetical protein PSPO01_03472 [Paraphaeosphaeria sporulosa]
MPHSEYDTEPRIDTSIKHGDWRDDLYRDGYYVVKGVLPTEKAQSYVDRMFNWLESFPYGFKKDDKSTWNPKHLPDHIKGGMFYGYHCQHEKVLWDARTEPAIIDAFAKLWGTSDLLVSFDGMNFTLPAEHPPSEPWPHVDQVRQTPLSRRSEGKSGGTTSLLLGSSRSSPEKVGRGTWGSIDWFGFEKDEVTWFEDRGCELVKVCADPGDLILWDSRTIHYNKLPESQNLRAVMYICYTPAAFASEEDRRKKVDYYNSKLGTTHWPHANIFHQEDKHLRLGKPDTYSRDAPFEEAEETELVLKLAGVKAY